MQASGFRYGADEFASGRTGMRKEGAGKNYVWQQTQDAMSVALPIKEGVGAKHLRILCLSFAPEVCS